MGTGKETSLGERLMGVYLPTLFEFSGVEGQGGAENYLSGCGQGDAIVWEKEGGECYLMDGAAPASLSVAFTRYFPM